MSLDPAATPQKIWSSALEKQYASALRKIARYIQRIIRDHFDGTPDSAVITADELNGYSDTLRDWALSAAEGMVKRANANNYSLFMRRSRIIGRQLRFDIYNAPIGQVVQDTIARQIGLITSLPRDAASRVQNLAMSGYVSGHRVGEIRRLRAGEYGPLDKVPEGLAKEILKTGEVTASRANLIARTETTRVSTELTQARSKHVGSEEFIWRTARDADVRRMHRKLEGTKHRWDDPPVAEENGVRHLPGCFPNCRCYAQPVLPDKI